MKDHRISLSSTRPDPNNPNWTTPRTYGVWELPAGSTGHRYRYGNNPVRKHELEREHGGGKLIELYLLRDAAKSHARKLNTQKNPYKHVPYRSFKSLVQALVARINN